MGAMVCWIHPATVPLVAFTRAICPVTPPILFQEMLFLFPIVHVALEVGLVMTMAGIRALILTGATVDVCVPLAFIVSLPPPVVPELLELEDSLVMAVGNGGGVGVLAANHVAIAKMPRPIIVTAILPLLIFFINSSIIAEGGHSGSIGLGNQLQMRYASTGGLWQMHSGSRQA